MYARGCPVGQPAGKSLEAQGRKTLRFTKME